MRGWQLGLLLVTLLFAHAARAAEIAEVALFPVAGDEALHERLVAELRSHGTRVVEVPSVEGVLGAEAALQAVTRAGSSAALLVESTPGALRVFIANRDSGKRVFREVELDDPAHPDKALEALWIVEILRASSLDTPLPAPKPSPPARREQAPSATRDAWLLQIAPALALSTGGLDPAPMALLGLRWQAAAHAGVEAVGLLPTLPVQISGERGRAQVSLGALGLGGYVTSDFLGGHVALQSAAGAAAILLHAQGQASERYAGRADNVLVWGPYLRAGAALKVSSSLRLRVDAFGGYALTRPVIYLGDARAAEWGQPWLSLAAGLEVRL